MMIEDRYAPKFKIGDLVKVKDGNEILTVLDIKANYLAEKDILKWSFNLGLKSFGMQGPVFYFFDYQIEKYEDKGGLI